MSIRFFVVRNQLLRFISFWHLNSKCPRHICLTQPNMLPKLVLHMVETYACRIDSKLYVFKNSDDAGISPECLCLSEPYLVNSACWVVLNLLTQLFQGYHQFGFKSDPTFCLAWYGSKRHEERNKQTTKVVFSEERVKLTSWLNLRLSLALSALFFVSA